MHRVIPVLISHFVRDIARLTFFCVYFSCEKGGIISAGQFEVMSSYCQAQELKWCLHRRSRHRRKTSRYTGTEENKSIYHERNEKLRQESLNVSYINLVSKFSATDAREKSEVAANKVLFCNYTAALFCAQDSIKLFNFAINGAKLLKTRQTW